MTRITWLNPDPTPTLTIDSALPPFGSRERWRVKDSRHEYFAYFSDELFPTEKEATDALNTGIDLLIRQIEAHRTRAMISIKAAAEKL